MPYSILSQNITVIKTSDHTYANDSLVCLDPIAARRVMYERTEQQNIIVQHERVIHILDSVVYARSIALDSTRRRCDINYNNWAQSENIRTQNEQKYESNIKTSKTLNWVLAAVTILISIIKIK